MGSKTGGGFLSGKGKTPGPGSYTVDSRPKTAGGAFGGKYGSSLAINPQTGDRVGPGSYNYAGGKSSKNVGRDNGFGTDKSGRGFGGGNDRAPGPGMYNTRTSMEIENGHIFGTSTRKGDKDRMMNPGPGQYSLGSSIQNGNGASMKAKTAYGGFL